MVKKHEYREVKPYWCARFLKVDGKRRKLSWWKNYFDLVLHNMTESIEASIFYGRMEFMHNHTVTFSNGMTPPIPRFEIANKGISIGYGLERFGADKGNKYFIIYVGDIISKKN